MWHTYTRDLFAKKKKKNVPNTNSLFKHLRFCKTEGEKSVVFFSTYIFTSHFLNPTCLLLVLLFLLTHISCIQSLPDPHSSTSCNQDQPGCRRRGVYHPRSAIKTKTQKTKHYSLVFFFPTIVLFPFASSHIQLEKAHIAHYFQIPQGIPADTTNTSLSLEKRTKKKKRVHL